MSLEQLHSKFEHISNVISTEKFLKMEALGGEIPFWISPYKPAQEYDVQVEVENLSKRLLNNNIKPCLIDLFDLSMQIADEQIGLDNVWFVEERKSKEKLKSALQSTINVQTRLIPAIKAKVESDKHQVLMIYGVGKVFPFIRSHTVLNNLQSAITHIPTLMFFPGEYTGRSLELFGLLKDDNYYRAFNIDQFKL